MYYNHWRFWIHAVSLVNRRSFHFFCFYFLLFLLGVSVTAWDPMQKILWALVMTMTSTLKHSMDIVYKEPSQLTSSSSLWPRCLLPVGPKTKHSGFHFLCVCFFACTRFNSATRCHQPKAYWNVNIASFVASKAAATNYYQFFFFASSFFRVFFTSRLPAALVTLVAIWPLNSSSLLC